MNLNRKRPRPNESPSTVNRGYPPVEYARPDIGLVDIDRRNHADWSEASYARGYDNVNPDHYFPYNYRAPDYRNPYDSLPVAPVPRDYYFHDGYYDRDNYSYNSRQDPSFHPDYYDRHAVDSYARSYPDISESYDIMNRPPPPDYNPPSSRDYGNDYMHNGYNYNDYSNSKESYASKRGVDIISRSSVDCRYPLPSDYNPNDSYHKSQGSYSNGLNNYNKNVPKKPGERDDPKLFKKPAPNAVNSLGRNNRNIAMVDSIMAAKIKKSDNVDTKKVNISNDVAADYRLSDGMRPKDQGDMDVKKTNESPRKSDNVTSPTKDAMESNESNVEVKKTNYELSRRMDISNNLIMYHLTYSLAQFGLIPVEKEKVQEPSIQPVNSIEEPKAPSNTIIPSSEEAVKEKPKPAPPVSIPAVTELADVDMEIDDDNEAIKIPPPPPSPSMPSNFSMNPSNQPLHVNFSYPTHPVFLPNQPMPMDISVNDRPTFNAMTGPPNHVVKLAPVNAPRALLAPLSAPRSQGHTKPPPPPPPCPPPPVKPTKQLTKNSTPAVIPNRRPDGSDEQVPKPPPPPPPNRPPAPAPPRTPAPPSYNPNQPPPPKS